MGNKNQKAMMPELTDEVTLCNELFSKCCHDELREIDKHEIIVKICQIIGSTPENLCKAEEVFNTIKYKIFIRCFDCGFWKNNGYSLF